MSFIAGEFVNETFDYDGGRQVTVYVPPDSPDAVVFAGDGQLISQWGGILEAADLRSTLIVGAHRLDDEMARIHAYSPGFDPERFSAHEEFFVEHVRRWTRSRCGMGVRLAKGWARCSAPATPGSAARSLPSMHRWIDHADAQDQRRLGKIGGKRLDGDHQA